MMLVLKPKSTEVFNFDIVMNNTLQIKTIATKVEVP
jgi:hypothetical protein